MNNFLLSRNDVDIATKFLEENNLVSSGLSCKNWEISQVIPFMEDGAWIDLGSDGSVVLDNLVKKNIKGAKVGIDLAYKIDAIAESNGSTIHLIKGDLMNVPAPNGTFDFITSLSVIEHEVDFKKFAYECSRLLTKNGQLFVSFDFWQPKPEYEKRKLYSLDWNILDKQDVLNLILALARNGMEVNGEIDWTLQDAVINKNFCAPADVEYTFGILNFIKK